MEEKARKRFILSWRMAKRFPTIMVITLNMQSNVYHSCCRTGNTLYNREAKTKTIAPLLMTERNAVTAIGEPSYTTAVQKWK